jgi:hypothetical protein
MRFIGVATKESPAAEAQSVRQRRQVTPKFLGPHLFVPAVLLVASPVPAPPRLQSPSCPPAAMVRFAKRHSRLGYIVIPDAPARVLYRPRAAYPPQLIGAGWEATVSLVIVFDTTGVPIVVEPARTEVRPRHPDSIGRDPSPTAVQRLFEQAAVEAGRSMRFGPATKAGRPARVLVCQSMIFKL